MTDTISAVLEQFYHGDVPAYITDAGKTFLTIRVSDWDGTRTLKITITDVIEYYATDARNILSGIRTLAGHSGDWRPIDALAKEALAWFKYVNRTRLAREGEKRGMLLRA
jgi:hypothetical protein